jgi:hypothetical protein
MSWARNPAEEELFRKSVTSLAKLGNAMFLTDKGSSESFTSFLENIRNLTLLPPQAGLWNQVKSSLLGAYQSKKKYIFYTEPDKLLFFTRYLANMLDEITVTEKTGIVVASRTQKAFSTFPEFQQKTETCINHCCAEVTGQEFDFVYGPFLINREIIPFLTNLPEDIGWGWRPFAFNIAKRLGNKIESYSGDFVCPEDQRKDNEAERIYRIKQLNQNIDGLLLSVSEVINTEGSR